MAVIRKTTDGRSPGDNKFPAEYYMVLLEDRELLKYFLKMAVGHWDAFRKAAS
jgi:hypothetical protein